MEFSVEDRFVRRVLTPLMPVVFCLMVLPATLVILAYVGTNGFLDVQPWWVLWIERFFALTANAPVKASGFLSQLIPALITALCFRSSRSRSLSRAGRASFFVVLIGIVLGSVAVMLIDPTNAVQENNISGGRPTLQRMAEGANATLSLSLTYFALLIGFRVKVEQS